MKMTLLFGLQLISAINSKCLQSDEVYKYSHFPWHCIIDEMESNERVERTSGTEMALHGCFKWPTPFIALSATFSFSVRTQLSRSHSPFVRFGVFALVERLKNGVPKYLLLAGCRRLSTIAANTNYIKLLMLYTNKLSSRRSSSSTTLATHTEINKIKILYLSCSSFHFHTKSRIATSGRNKNLRIFFVC